MLRDQQGNLAWNAPLSCVNKANYVDHSVRSVFLTNIRPQPP
jgi:hypothetical protein